MTLKLWPTIIVLALGSMVLPNSFAAERAFDTVIYQSEGLTLRPAHSSRLQIWCSGGNYNRYNVAVFYDTPHEQRLKRLGESYEAFVQDIVVPTIKKTCESFENFGGGSGIVSDVKLVMRRSNYDPKLSLHDISRSEMWDIFDFRIGKEGVFATSYKPVAAKKRVKKAPVDVTVPTVPLPKPFFESEQLAIYPVASYWCQTSTNKLHKNVDLDIVYDVTHAERKTVLFYGKESAANYERFFNKIIIPIITQHCPSYTGLAANANLRLNTRTDWLKRKRIENNWDRLEFQYYRGTESPRVCRRLNSLRGFSNEDIKEIFPGSPGTGGPYGFRAST